ncbi:hypothetical protein, partial [Bartonella sp. CL2QHWL]|uniref:hypothetical protein n=1 Tax=Bartonella sp. CL2QHWL TaxID=3243523 RepID=UPI0035D1334E
GLVNGWWRNTPSSLAGPVLDRHTCKATIIINGQIFGMKNGKLKQRADFLLCATVKTEKNLEEFFL